MPLTAALRAATLPLRRREDAPTWGEWFHRDPGDGVNLVNLWARRFVLPLFGTADSAASRSVGNTCIVDFYAASLKLVVEIDGGYHAARSAEDAARTAMLEQLHGVRVIRFEASRVEADLRAVLAELASASR